jgi:hypothetical protein
MSDKTGCLSDYKSEFGKSHRIPPNSDWRKVPNDNAEISYPESSRILSAVYYRRDWEISASVNRSMGTQNPHDLSQAKCDLYFEFITELSSRLLDRVHILDYWRGFSEKQLLVSSSIYSLGWRCFQRVTTNDWVPPLGTDFELQDLIDLSEAHSRAKKVSPDLTFNGAELIHGGCFKRLREQIGVPIWVFFQFPTVYDKDDQNIPDIAKIVIVPALGAGEAQILSQFAAADWVSL